MKPILFNTEMVKAILDGRKTVTRRVVKKDIANQFDVEHDNKTVVAFVEQSTGDSYSPVDVAPYKVGDILYVRETFCPNYFDDCIASLRNGNKNAYKADYNKSIVGDVCPEPKWNPSIHMPKSVARIFLKVTNVRVERLQDITETQVKKEGFRDYLAESDTFYPCGYYFRQTWDSIIKKKDIDHYGWNANPWVFVIEFEKIEGSEGNG